MAHINSNEESKGLPLPPVPEPAPPKRMKIGYVEPYWEGEPFFKMPNVILQSEVIEPSYRVLTQLPNEMESED